MSYYAPIPTTELTAVKETARCYCVYLTNRIRIARERGIPFQYYTDLRAELECILMALGQWQQSPNGSTGLYDNPFTAAGLNGMVGFIRANCGTGCIALPPEDANTYVVVLEFLTDYGDYISALP